MYNKSVFFPCVVLFKNGDFNACSNEVSLSSYSEIFIDNGSLDYAKVIDIYGNMFFIDNVIKLRNKNILPKFFVRYTKRIVQVSFTLNFIEQLDVNQMKEYIIFSLQSNQKLFLHYKELGILQWIKGAESYMEIIESLGID